MANEAPTIVACLLFAGLVVAGTIAVNARSNDRRCTIVTDGGRDVYRHELAHCNGWNHEAFIPADPPAEYVHHYDGTLTIIQCGRQTRLNAQEGTIFIKGCKNARKRCIALWEARGDDVSAYVDTPGWKNFVGCSLGGM